MGCTHYESAADAAQQKIDQLEAERAEYVAAQTAVDEAVKSIECYTEYLSLVDSTMSSVVVNGKPFDKGESAVHNNNLNKGINSLEALKNEMTEALREIANEILSLEPIVDDRDKVCGPCSAPPPSKPALQ